MAILNKATLLALAAPILGSSTGRSAPRSTDHPLYQWLTTQPPTSPVSLFGEKLASGNNYMNVGTAYTALVPDSSFPSDYNPNHYIVEGDVQAQLLASNKASIAHVNVDGNAWHYVEMCQDNQNIAADLAGATRLATTVDRSAGSAFLLQNYGVGKYEAAGPVDWMNNYLADWHYVHPTVEDIEAAAAKTGDNGTTLVFVPMSMWDDPYGAAVHHIATGVHGATSACLAKAPLTVYAEDDTTLFSVWYNPSDDLFYFHVPKNSNGEVCAIQRNPYAINENVVMWDSTKSMVFTLLAGEIPIMDGMPCYDNFLALADVKPEGWEAPLTRPIPPPPVAPTTTESATTTSTATSTASTTSTSTSSDVDCPGKKCIKGKADGRAYLNKMHF